MSSRSNKQKKDATYAIREDLYNIALKAENLPFTYGNVKEFAFYAEKTGGVPKPLSIPNAEFGCSVPVAYIVGKKVRMNIARKN